MMATTTFDIHIGSEKSPSGDALFPVDAESSITGSTATGTVALNVNDDKFRKLRVKIEGIAPNLADRTEFGRELFQRLFAGEIRELWIETLGRLATADKPILHIRLRIDVPELAALPWELLYDNRKNRFLATNTDTVLLRYLPGQDAGDLPPQPTLRILLAVADPRGPLDLPAIGQAAIDQVERAIKELAPSAELTLLRSVNVARLQQQLQQLQPHILHVMAHGVTGEIALVSDNESTMSTLGEKEFAQLFSNRKNLRLVLLNVCQSAQAMSGSVFSGVGPALIAQGVPAVIAMQYSTVQLETASLFSRAFYKAVTSNSVEVAVNEARQLVSASELVGDRDWSTPVLYVGTKTGKIIELAPNAAPKTISVPIAVDSPVPTVKPAKDDVIKELNESTATLRRAWRIEVALLELEMRVRELAEALRQNSADTMISLSSKLSFCFNIIPRLDEMGDVPTAKLKLTSKKFPTAMEVMQSLEKIEQNPTGNPDDLFGECSQLVRLLQFATSMWRRVSEKELDAVVKNIGTLTQ